MRAAHINIPHMHANAQRDITVVYDLPAYIHTYITTFVKIINYIVPRT